MSDNQISNKILSIGLSRKKENELLSILGADVTLERFSLEGKGTGYHGALAAFVSWKGVNGRISGFNRNVFSDTDFPARILVLDGHVTQTELERIVDAGFFAVVHYPFDPKRINTLVEQIAESQGMYKDLFLMAREICLEREILGRQADLLHFFNRILTQASFSLDPAEILQQAHDDLQILAPVKSVEAIFWQKNHLLENEAELFIHDYSSKNVQNDLINYLLEHAEKHADSKITGYHANFMSLHDKIEDHVEVHKQDMLILPLRFGGRTFGCMSITVQKISRLGRDRTQTILAAVNHFALALRNALIFQEMKFRADRDALTRLPNRHFFDQKLLEETKRHQRYGSPLSIMMLDLDHFKKINDTHGHQAGDMVLQEVGRILIDTLRTSDSPARMGGEEFVALLAHTTEKQAWALSERIREALARHRYHFNGKFFKVTASIGVATLKGGFLNSPVDLMGAADAALYKAKELGRNMVYMASEVNEEAEEADQPLRKMA